ncbi:MAG TPA: PIN domain-containing protein [Egibacteraceae bacterium]|nr:PIN domain-containing protein [Egibacteraceae bacterium]
MILDAGVFVSVDRDEERARVFLTAAERAGEPLHTSEAVVAQVWRDGARQARLAAVLKAIEVHALDDGRAVGAMLARSDGSDVVDAHVVFLGAALSQRVLTADPGDLQIIAGAMGRTQPDILVWG